MNAPISTQSANDLAALLALLVDPIATQARLDELVTQEAATREQIAALNAMADETRRMHNTAQATNIVSDNRRAALDAREGDLDQRQEAIEASEAARSDAALHRRETAVQAREEASKKEAERLATMRADYETRIAKLREAMP